jgi:hypothetical protein
MQRRILISTILVCAGLAMTTVLYGNHKTDKHSTASLSDEELQHVNAAVGLEKQSRFREALSRIERIRSSSPVVALQLVQFKQHLAAQILDRAQNEYRRGNVTKALRFAKVIPMDSPAWQRFRKVQDDWERNQVVIELARQLCSSN